MLTRGKEVVDVLLWHRRQRVYRVSRRTDVFPVTDTDPQAEDQRGEGPHVRSAHRHPRSRACAALGDGGVCALLALCLADESSEERATVRPRHQIAAVS